MRTGKLADLASGDTVRATRALLYLTYEDPDRRWLEGNEPQLRALAVTCMGHLGRMRGAVGAEVVACLERLLGEPELGGVAEDALGDVGWFAEVAPGE
ncbi:hypothetical protein [Streptomyces acidiscabies]|uniref:hypothetical protein n=1 Tax=Streptomyces acidiscabies TaxID=42234 RepID=UPI0009528771|nr:hypothetical protein [Streptomyces acidiscabies]